MIFPDKLLHGFILFKHHAAAFLVAGEKSVKRHNDRQFYRFCNFQSADIHIINRLRRIGEQDNPSGVKGKHNVTMVTLNAQRSRNRPAGNIHHHRETCAGLHRKLFQRIKQPVRACRVEYPAAAC